MAYGCVVVVRKKVFRDAEEIGLMIVDEENVAVVMVTG